MPQTGSIFSGVKSRTLAFSASKPFGVRLHVLDVDHALGDDDVEHGIEQRHVAARLELQDVAGVAGKALAAARAGR